jgi:hypothetical protein
MPTLNWIGKDAVVNYHHQVPFHLLKDVPELAAGDLRCRSNFRARNFDLCFRFAGKNR